VGRKRAGRDAEETVRKLMKAGKIKDTCCRSRPRCKTCPVLALMKAKGRARKTN
jgi:adenine-specific DNA glycosylase